MKNALFLQLMKSIIIALFIVFSIFNPDHAQSKPEGRTFFMMSYNVENLYDTLNDPRIADDEFTPTGRMHWNTMRYIKKLSGIAKVISCIRPGDYPDIIVLCEIENRNVLQDLVNQQALKTSHYKIVHKDSRDTRGIDVALLYRSNKFKVLSWHVIRVKYPGEKSEHTRDILYVKGVALNRDTLHIFGNHWKSRNGNIADTEPKRLYEAGILRSKIDSLLKKNRNSYIICMGDFNDEPTSKSIIQVLGAACDKDQNFQGNLIDVMCQPHLHGKGTYRYKNKWLMLENIIVSKKLFASKSGMNLSGTEGNIYSPAWLLKYNPKAGEAIPYKTYGGDKYLGGYSDHLPVYIVLIKN